MVKYKVCRKTGRTLSVERFESPRDVSVKQAAQVIAKIMPPLLTAKKEK